MHATSNSFKSKYLENVGIFTYSKQKDQKKRDIFRVLLPNSVSIRKKFFGIDGIISECC